MRFKPISDEDLQHLRMARGTMFLSGQCVAFAVAVHRRAGWPLLAVRDGAGNLQHAGFRNPKGVACDARGAIGESELAHPWGGAMSETDEETLLADDPKIDAEAIEAADHVAGLLFPDLPGSSAKQERLRAFAEGLEALCRGTGVWIRSDGPHGIPVYDAYGDEGEFEVSVGAAGDARIDRTL
jgi:hypothetical protein